MQTHKKLKVAVLMGGPSEEHEVSLKSGEMVANNLDPDQYYVRRVLIDKNGEWEVSPRNLKTYADITFIALHGQYGEDGTVQDVLQQVGIPYTGTGPLESAFAMNKLLSLRHFQDAGFAVPLSYLVTKSDWQDRLLSVLHQIKHYFGYPLVVKPNNSGSSCGITIVKSENSLTAAFNEAFNVSREALIQEYIRGREVTCGVLDHGWPGSEHALLPTEVIPRVSHFFDYKAKYEKGGSDEITPPSEMPEHMIRTIQKTARAIHQLSGCRGFSRVDMILDHENRPVVLEVNTIPGLTPESLLPKAVEASGISFSTMLDRLIHVAFLRAV